MGIEELSWDSTFFKKRIGQARILSADSLDALARQLPEEQRFDCVYLRAPGKALADGLQRRLPEAGQPYEKRIYERKLLSGPSEPVPDWVVPLPDNRPREALYELALASGHASRFTLDPRFHDSAPAYFRAWIDNSLCGDRADHLWVAQKGGRTSGLVTLKLSGVAEIGLLAVGEDFRGQGLGGALLAAAETCAHEHGHHRLLISTQGENKSGVSFYEKAGYTIAETEYIFHYWLS